MIIRTMDNYLYHRKVAMTGDGQVWVPLKDIKKSINSIRTAEDGKCTTKKLETMLEALDIMPTKFSLSSSLYIRWEEAQIVEKAFIAYEMGDNDNEAFNLKA